MGALYPLEDMTTLTINALSSCNHATTITCIIVYTICKNCWLQILSWPFCFIDLHTMVSAKLSRYQGQVSASMPMNVY